MKKYFNKAILTILSTSTLFLLFGHGCGQFELNDSVFSSLASEEEISIIPNAKTASTVYANQFLNNMISCTGLSEISSRTRAEFRQRKGSLPEYGHATKISGPALMSIAAVAGEVCADLIEVDAKLSAEEKLFTTDLQSVIQKLAISCWNRRAIDSEVNEILNGIELDSDSISQNSDNQAEYDMHISICTSILASTSAIEM